jgi:hypothetical protein
MFFNKILTFKNFLWAVYIGVLVVVTPHTQWMFAQLEPPELPGLSWVIAIVVEAAIFGLTHMLTKHIAARRLNTFNFERKRMEEGLITKYLTWWPVFRYRWLNVYSLGLALFVLISGVANLTHAFEYGRPPRTVGEWGIPFAAYTLMFGAALPVMNLLFAAVLAQVDDAEQQADPELEKAKADRKEAERRLKESERALAETERLLKESEQRYHAVGDVVVYLFGTERALAERVRYVRKTFPQLSQHGIGQILGCSVSTVNEALRETIDA